MHRSPDWHGCTARRLTNTGNRPVHSQHAEITHTERWCKDGLFAVLCISSGNSYFPCETSGILSQLNQKQLLKRSADTHKLRKEEIWGVSQLEHFHHILTRWLTCPSLSILFPSMSLLFLCIPRTFVLKHWCPISLPFNKPLFSFVGHLLKQNIKNTTKKKV